MTGIEKYQSLARPPADALKKITGGRLNGKSDINPQWRYKAMTESFGLCGIGWKYTIDRLWTEQGTEGQVFAWAQVSVYVKENDKWSDAIPGVGGNFLIESESKGLHNNDEAFKMATTDALGTAMKMIGVAADVYAGAWDGTKYIDEGEKPNPPKAPPKPEPSKLSAQNPIGKPPEAAMKERSLAIIKQLALTPEDAEAVLEKHGGKKVGEGWQGIKWADVLNDVNSRLAGKVGVSGLMPDDSRIPF